MDYRCNISEQTITRLFRTALTLYHITETGRSEQVFRAFLDAGQNESRLGYLSRFFETQDISVLNWVAGPTWDNVAPTGTDMSYRILWLLSEHPLPDFKISRADWRWLQRFYSQKSVFLSAKSFVLSVQFQTGDSSKPKVRWRAKHHVQLDTQLDGSNRYYSDSLEQPGGSGGSIRPVGTAGSD